MRNSKGAAVIFLLSCLPFLLSLAALAGAIALGMAAHATNLFTCRLELMQSQQDFADPFNRLLDLNNEAAVLHAQYERAKVEALAAPTNPLLLARLQAQIAENKAFHGKQTELLRQARVQPETRLHQLPQTMVQALAKELPIDFAKALEVDVPDVQVSVAPIQLDEFTWSYQTTPGFSRKQALTARWRLHTKQILPQWIQKFLSDIPDIEGECSATVEKGKVQDGGLQWSPILGTGRS